MRLPISSETDAFRSVFVVAVVAALCLILASVFGPVPAVVVASLALLVLLAWILTPSDSSLRIAQASGSRGHVRRTLPARV